MPFRYRWNAETRWPDKEPVDPAAAHLWRSRFGQEVGMIAFDSWYPAIRKGHQIHQKTFDFPLRLEFVSEPFAPESREQLWFGWRLPAFVAAAQRLEAAGCRALVTGCGLLGSIQTELAEAVEIPVFTSTLQMIPLLRNALQRTRKVGVLTVSEAFLRRFDNAAFSKCGVPDHGDLIVAGICESPHAQTWWTQFSDLDFDPSRIEALLIDIVFEMRLRHPELGALVLECTELTPYKDTLKRHFGLPVVDAVDLVHHVRRLVDLP